MDARASAAHTERQPAKQGGQASVASRRTVRFTAYLLIVGLLYLTGGLLVYLLHYAPAAPLPVDGFVKKRRLLAHSRGQFSSAAFGSSHIDQGFAPLVFDREMSQWRTKTLNFGLPGANMDGEREFSAAFLHQVPASAGQQPCFFLIEVDPEVVLDRRHAEKKARAMSAKPVTEERARWGAEYAGRLWADIRAIPRAIVSEIRYLTVGRHAYSADDLANAERGQQLPPLAPGHDPQFDQVPALQQAFFEHPSAPHPQALPLYNLQLLAALQAAAPSRRLALVDVVYPLQSDYSDIRDYPEQVSIGGQTYPVVNLARPDLYPSLYATSYWNDTSHMNHMGSEAATALLSSRLKIWYATHGSPAACGE